MVRRPPVSTPLYASAASDVDKGQVEGGLRDVVVVVVVEVVVVGVVVTVVVVS